MDNNDLDNRFREMRAAYKDLFLGSLGLLEMDFLVWTERILLRIVNWLAKQRLEQIKSVYPRESQLFEDGKILKDNMLEAQVEASLGKHRLGEWKMIQDEGGYQAMCEQCGGTVYVSDKSCYSILDDICPLAR